jgi:hypothetical protein
MLPEGTRIASAIRGRTTAKTRSKATMSMISICHGLPQESPVCSTHPKPFARSRVEVENRP